MTAGSGELLVSARGPRAAVSVAGRLVPDPAGPVAPELVAALLARIGLADPAGPGAGPVVATWVAPDGSWVNGPLRGRHTVTAARHIGAAARAAHRARRLREIETELRELRAALQERARRRAQLAERRTAIQHTTCGPLRDPPR
ncbi:MULTISPECIES: hypothetical protein [Pseudofrankia]|uniref:hypothetical protein n=1 Tax=Pseudofrankia TaxID=2994363 RepID=UPI000234D3E7|nr:MULTISPECIES: hypothetical protein [Pseudofrankia]OHV27914.1 hypothetical protein BCD49_38460 [Pseudofrankia sp. EUN1h]